MIGTLADIRDAWKARRWAGVVAELREAVQFRLFRHGEVLIVEEDLGRITPAPPPDGVEIRGCSSTSEWDRLATFVNRRTMARFRRASSRGRICVVAWRGTRPVGYTWLSRRLDPDLETFPLTLPAGAFYGWDLFVEPSERRSGIGSALVTARLLEAKALGGTVCWRAINPANRGAAGTVRKLTGDGTRILGRFRYVKMFGRIRGRMLPPP